MFFHLKSLLIAILFFGVLEITFYTSSLFWQVGVFLILFSVWSAKVVSGKKRLSIVPIVFSIAALMFSYLIDRFAFQQVLGVMAAIVFYFIYLGIVRIKNYQGDRTAHGIISGGLMATVFFFYAGFYGLYINFSIPISFLMLVFMAATFFLSFHYLNIISPDRNKVLSYSLILGFAMAEISWVINFWPFGYLTTGVIALIFYYMFWDIAQNYFINKLSKKKIVTNLIFFSLLIGLILWSSRWQLAV